jgi:hypothetical protein
MSEARQDKRRPQGDRADGVGGGAEWPAGEILGRDYGNAGGELAHRVSQEIGLHSGGIDADGGWSPGQDADRTTHRRRADGLSAGTSGS